MIGRKFDYSLKVIAVGDSGVGKTSFLARFVRDNFDDEIPSTLGVEFMSKIIETEKHRIQLQLWDTAGQELFRSVTRGYYRGSVGALLLFDLSKPDSFESINSWLNDVREIARPECVVALIGNKLDLCPPSRQSEVQKEEDNKSEQDKSNYVSREEAEKYAKQNSMLYYEVSAKTGQNVKVAFDGLVAAIEKNLDSGVYELPSASDQIDFKNEEEQSRSCC